MRISSTGEVISTPRSKFSLDSIVALGWDIVNTVGLFFTSILGDDGSQPARVNRGNTGASRSSGVACL